MEKSELNKKLELAKLKKMYAKQLKECFTSEDPESVPTAEQQRCLNDINTTPVRWVVSSNRAGKSQSAARECAWLFNNDHPTFERPKEWGGGSITLVIVGKKITLMEEELWDKKVRPLLEPGSYTVKRNSSGIEKVTHKTNGNKILFQSHNNPEEARKSIQGHTLHWVWLDEMPESHRLVSELVMRITTTNGRIIGTFTPLIHNIEIKKMIDKAAEPIARRYNFSIFDNPAIQDRIETIIETIRQNCSSEAEFRCRVYGEWMTAGHRVSCYDPDKHYVELGDNYDMGSWRHVAIVDPSASGLTGVSVWGEDPADGTWYNVMADYVNGDAAYILVGEVEAMFAKYNLVLRGCDPNPAGFYKEAARRKIWYRTVSDKAYRKTGLIDGANAALAQGRMKLTQYSDILAEELTTCSWNDAGDKIVKASRFHCFDTMQYAADMLPSYDPEAVVSRNHLETVKYEWHKVKKEKAKKLSYQILKKQRRNRFARNRR